MRWQNFGFEDTEGMCVDIATFPLDQLYQRQAWLENQIKTLRDKEPKSKRNQVQFHQIWFDLCQSYIKDLQEVRDAICIKKGI